MEREPERTSEGAPRSVITRVVKAGHEREFEDWLHGISQEAARFQGHLSVTIFRPPPDGHEYVVILQFDRHDNLNRWLDSDVRRSWIKRSEPLTEEPERRAESTGLEHWFTLPGRPEHRAPDRLKMAVLTILAAYPTILGLNLALDPILARVPHLLAALVVTTCLTFLLTYLLMPNITRLFYRWLYPGSVRP